MGESEPMKILYHHRTRGTDAQKVHIREMIRAFRGLGHAVEVVAVADVEGKAQDCAEEAQPAWWQRLVRKIPFGYELVQCAYNAVGVPLLINRLIGRKVDLIYERYSLFNFSGVLAARLFRLPIVLEVNSPLALEQWRDKHIRTLWFARWTESRICNSATKVIVVSRPLQRMMVENGVEEKKLVVMSNGVNPADFRSSEDSRKVREVLGLSGKIVVGFVGWFREWHGLEILIEAFGRSGLGQRGARLLLVGDGPAMSDLRKAIQQRQLNDVVVLPGAIRHEDVPTYLGLIDIAVQPAANEYCCPMKVLEYLALGKPIVAPRQENIEELVADRQNGILFKPRDSDDLARALEELVKDPELRDRIGRRGRLMVGERGWHWATNARRVIEMSLGSSPSDSKGLEKSLRARPGLSR